MAYTMYSTHELTMHNISPQARSFADSRRWGPLAFQLRYFLFVDMRTISYPDHARPCCTSRLTEIGMTEVGAGISRRRG